jgi:hypothetical protein
MEGVEMSADDLKAKGNEEFKNAKYAEAIDFYSQALGIVN